MSSGFWFERSGLEPRLGSFGVFLYHKLPLWYLPFTQVSLWVGTIVSSYCITQRNVGRKTSSERNTSSQPSSLFTWLYKNKKHLSINMSCNTQKIPASCQRNLMSYQTLQFQGHFTVVYLVAKPLIWSEAEGDIAVIETSIQLA